MRYTFAQVNDRNGLVVMRVLLSITSATAVNLRLHVRKLKGLEFQADDWLSAAFLVSPIQISR